MSSIVIPTTGHSWNDGEVTTEPTCTETGVMKYTYTVCGVIYYDTISETGHTIARTDIVMIAEYIYVPQVHPIHFLMTKHITS